MSEKKSMPLLVLGRNHTLTSTFGHSIAFVKGTPTYVPPAMYRAALEIGATPVDGKVVDVLDDPVKTDPVDPLERNEKIAEAIELLVRANDRQDFTAAGTPTVAAVSGLVGFKVSATEVTAQWQLYHEKKAAAE